MLPAPALPGTTENVATSAEPRHGATVVCATAALVAAESASAATATGAATPLMSVSLPEQIRIETDVERAVGTALERERPLRAAGAVGQDQLEPAAELPRRRAQLPARAEQLVVPGQGSADRGQQVLLPVRLRQVAEHAHLDRAADERLVTVGR